MMQTNYYYIFGLDAIRVYQEEKDRFIKFMKKDTTIGMLYRFDITTMIPSEILDEFSGWGDYIEITQEEYNYFKKEIYGE